MSTYVLMRILESAPRRYELGIRILTLGHLDKAYDRLASHIDPGQQVLDIGCGTGALTLRAARRGAKVKGIDINPQMLEIASQNIKRAGLSKQVELAELGVAELDAETAEQYDVVISGLCFSELSEDEIHYTLKQSARLLKPGGLLLIADETRPATRVKRLLHALVRIPLAVLTYIITQQTTRPAKHLPEKIKAVGFTIKSVKFNTLGSFAEFVAQKPAGTGT